MHGQLRSALILATMLDMQLRMDRFQERGRCVRSRSWKRHHGRDWKKMVRRRELKREAKIQQRHMAALGN